MITGSTKHFVTVSYDNLKSSGHESETSFVATELVRRIWPHVYALCYVVLIQDIMHADTHMCTYARVHMHTRLHK